MQCRKCGEKINEDDRFCSKCGYEQTSTKDVKNEEISSTAKNEINLNLKKSTTVNANSKGRIFGVVGIILLVLIGMVYFNSHSIEKAGTEKVTKETPSTNTSKTDETSQDNTNTTQVEEDVPIQLSIDRISLTPQNEIEVTVTNSTDKDITLPSINFTCNLYKDGTYVGYQVVWLDNLNKGIQSYKSLPVDKEFDSIQPVAYMNDLKMIDAGLKSTVQADPDKGESVIPVLNGDMIKLH